jgi:predicted extracellular nuclease
MGKPNPNVLAASKAMFRTGLVDLAGTLDDQNRYSYVFDGSAQILDHMLVNGPARKQVKKLIYARLDADFPKIYAADYTRPERLSDHDPAVLYLSSEAAK